MKLTALSIGLASLAACASSATDTPTDGLKAQVINASPLKREIAASAHFYFCGEHPQSDRFVALCEVCNVDLYADKDLPFNADPDTDAPIVGVKGWATHFYHEFQQNGEEPEPRLVVTGERDSKRYETKDLSVSGIKALFSDANNWCVNAGAGEFVLLKDDISTFVEGLNS